MLARLQAEERLNAISDGEIATGAADREQRRERIGLLEKAARVQRGKAAKARPGTLASMGIGVKPSPPSEASRKRVKGLSAASEGRADG